MIFAASSQTKYYGLCSSIPEKMESLVQTIEPKHTYEFRIRWKKYLSKLSCKAASRVFISQKFEHSTAKRRLLQENLDEQAISSYSYL